MGKLLRNAAGGTNPFRWWEYDQLPPLVRRAMQAAPVELGTERAAFWLRSGASDVEVAKIELRVAEKARHRLLLECWPPGHPELAP